MQVRMSRLVAPAFSRVPRQPSASVPSPSLPAGSRPNVATSCLPPPRTPGAPQAPGVWSEGHDGGLPAWLRSNAQWSPADPAGPLSPHRSRGVPAVMEEKEDEDARYTRTPPVPAPSPCRLGVWKALASRAGALATNEERT